MAIIINDHLAKLLNDNRANFRLENWIWLCIATRGAEHEVHRHGPRNRDTMARFLLENQQIREEILSRRNSAFLPDKYFQWMVNDERQNAWLLHHIYYTLLRFRPSIPGILIDRDLVIGLIDYWDVDLQTKIHAIEQAKTLWNLYLQKDRFFDWFKKKDEQERCSFAWEWLKANHSDLVVSQSNISTHRELILFFDPKLMSDDTKTLMVEKIKKAWSQAQYRKNLKDKKQYNFVLSDKSISVLDRLGQKYELTRAEVIEVLIKAEAESETYLTARLKRRDALLS